MENTKMRPIWLNTDARTVKIIDQRRLPHELIITDLKTADDVITAIKEMYVRGAPLIGVTAAYGVYLAVLVLNEKGFDTDWLKKECQKIKSVRPTAINLTWAVDKMLSEVVRLSEPAEMLKIARSSAEAIAEFEAENCKKIGEYGLKLIEEIWQGKNGQTVNLLTHCNAGWLACVEYGTATAPMYAAFDKGIDFHVWVDETRPLNQGARLTAWELGRYGIKHTVITDNAGGHLMQHGMVDMVVVGTDRTTCAGDVANKIGTYLKALAAKDNNIPFYVALPSSTFDWNIEDGIKDIPIEQRDPDEVSYIQGLDRDTMRNVLITPKDSVAANYAFDVTPARLVTGFITERGICRATKNDIRKLFPEKKIP